MLRAKFRVNSVADYETCVSIEASPVYAGGDPAHENAKFWDASPSGSFGLSVTNPDAFEELKSLLGKEIYIDFYAADSVAD